MAAVKRSIAGFMIGAALLATPACGSQARDHIADTYEYRGTSAISTPITRPIL